MRRLQSEGISLKIPRIKGLNHPNCVKAKRLKPDLVAFESHQLSLRTHTPTLYYFTSLFAIFSVGPHLAN
jgi:hypothetical protein